MRGWSRPTSPAVSPASGQRWPRGWPPRPSRKTEDPRARGLLTPVLKTHHVSGCAEPFSRGRGRKGLTTGSGTSLAGSEAELPTRGGLGSVSDPLCLPSPLQNGHNGAYLAGLCELGPGKPLAQFLIHGRAPCVNHDITAVLFNLHMHPAREGFSSSPGRWGNWGSG